MLKRVAIPEVKFFDTAINTATATTLVKIPVSLMADGDTSSTRDGDEIMVKNLYVKGSITAVESNGNIADSHTRVLIVQDNQQEPDATEFTTLDFLQTNVWNSYYNADSNQRRFRVLSDKMYHFGQVNQAADASVYQETASSKYFSLNIKLNRKMYFNGPANTQVSQGRGKLYVCYISQLVNMEVDVQARMTFQDS